MRWMNRVAACLSFCVGCASTYTPVPSPYLVPVELPSCSGYMRDGRCFPLGYWGSGGEALVAGVHEAEAKIANYQSNRRKGAVFKSVLIGAGILGFGSVFYFEQQRWNPHAAKSGKPLVVGMVSLVIGIIAGRTALPYIADANRDLRDSVYLYNQAIEARQRRCSGLTEALPTLPSPIAAQPSTSR